jgi:hypothetical protein
MFFDQLDEGNSMLQSNLAFEELAQTGLARSNRVSTPEMLLLRSGPQVG